MTTEKYVGLDDDDDGIFGIVTVTFKLTPVISRLRRLSLLHPMAPAAASSSSH